MNHDVFISYSSKNPEAAQAICHVLEENGIKCWMAPRDIPLGSKYAAVISRAIKGSKAVVLVFSEQSAISPWVESEINIAFSNHKPIFPYKIDRAVLEKYDEFYLMLNSRHWIDSYPDFRTRFDELVQTVGKYVGVDVKKKPTSQPQVPPVPEPPVPPTPKPRRRWWLWALLAALAVAVGVGLFGMVEDQHNIDVLEGKGRDGVYEVGDYYNRDGKEGVVFDVWDDGRHGKILSLDQSSKQLQWCTNKQLDKKIDVGADSKSDGKVNTDKVMARGDADQYPAFTWCRDKGADWYLPAIDELRLLLLNDSVHDVVNKTIAQKGGTELYDIGLYWSSSEYNEFCAWYVYMGSGYTFNANRNKYRNLYVRAVSAF